MRNHELIKAIYDRCPNSPRSSTFSIDQYFDRCQDIIDMIEKERPELAKDDFWKGEYIEK
jgi:hypothetical protein